MQLQALQNKVAVVTGASRGIGRAITKKFADEGASIVVNYNNSEKEASILLKEIEGTRGKGVIVKADVSKAADVKSLVQNSLAAFGRIDVLVNNAGIHYPVDIFDHSEEMWDQTIDTNLKGAYMCSKEVAPIMLKQEKGKIINISSNSGMYFPSAMRFAEYVASKAGMNGLTKALALRFGPYITVNAICPGAIVTEMTSFRDSQANKALIEETPLKRLGTVEDVANAALFLASDLSDFITGELMLVTGGRGMHQ
ncbi:MAG: SDR family NAD(P)-dependent oxidoreductase [Nitrososphaerales archaeon]